MRDRVRCFLHIPIGFGKAMTSNLQKLESAQAGPEDFFVLADECSLWRTELYFDVLPDRADELAGSGATVETLSGTFRSQVFDGPYKDAGRWRQQLESSLAQEGCTVEKTYAFYTTCPKCAKAYGHNYVVLFGKV